MDDDRKYENKKLMTHIYICFSLFEKTFVLFIIISVVILTNDIVIVNRYGHLSQFIIPEVDLILDGREHDDYLLLRGSKYTPIYKSDENAFTVYIHQCAFNLNTKQFRVYSALTKVTREIRDEEKTNEVVNCWYNLGIKGFEEMGFKPNETVSCLPSGIELDGRSASVRNFPTSLSTYCCECMIKSSAESQTIDGIFDSEHIRIDDILRGKVTQYDILRTLPYQNNFFALSIPVEILSNVVSKRISIKGSGMYLGYSGVEKEDEGKTWFVNGLDTCAIFFQIDNHIINLLNNQNH
jgi:5'-nucleotidase/UDP-sugar diphosphatase